MELDQRGRSDRTDSPMHRFLALMRHAKPAGSARIKHRHTRAGPRVNGDKSTEPRSMRDDGQMHGKPLQALKIAGWPRHVDNSVAGNTEIG